MNLNYQKMLINMKVKKINKPIKMMNKLKIY